MMIPWGWFIRVSIDHLTWLKVGPKDMNIRSVIHHLTLAKYGPKQEITWLKGRLWASAESSGDDQD